MSSPGFYKKLVIYPWLLLCSLFIIIPTGVIGEEIGLDASWQASANHADDADNINAFNQRYGLHWNPRVTRAISLDTSMNYSRNVSSGNIIRETLSPTGSLQVQNDIFLAELNGFMNRSNNSQSFSQIDRNWEAILASTWEYEYWPTLSINIGQSWLNDTEETAVTDTSRKWSEVISQWELNEFEAYYSYYTQQRDDSAELSRHDEKKHFGRLDYSKSFLADRLSLTLSGQITNTTTDLTSTAGSGDNITIGVPLSQGLAGVDPLPETGRLAGAPGLIDGNTNSAVFTISRPEIANLGIKADLQAIDSLYVYTTSIDPLVINETSSLRWDLYSSDDGINWQREIINAVTSYDQNRFRFQVYVGGLKKIYLKLVVTDWPLALPIQVTEIEANRNQSSTGSDFTESQKYTRALADLNLRYTPTANTSISYSLVRDDSDYSTGNDRNRLFQTGNVRWDHSQYFMPSFTINNTSTTNSEISDNSQRSYALSVQSILLPTLETNVGITRNENTNDGTLETTNHTVHLNATAALYPNLDTTIDLNTTFNKNEVENSSDENMGLRWTITARLRPNLLVDAIAEHGTTGFGFDEFIDSQESGGRATLNINWRPSELLSILANVSQGYGEEMSNQQNFLLDTNLSLVRTSKSQITVGYKIITTQEDTVNSFNANWNWNISEFFTMQSIANYFITQENSTWFLNTRITARF